MDTAAVLDGLGDLLLGVDHVGLAVADLEAAVAFHTTVLGFTLTHRETNPEQGVVEAMLSAPAAADGGTQLQLLAPWGPESTIATFLDRRGPGLQQLALRVKDADLAGVALRNKGVRLLYDSSRPGTGGSRINFIHPKDAGGVLIELVEPARNSPEHPAGDTGRPHVRAGEQGNEGDLS